MDGKNREFLFSFPFFVSFFLKYTSILFFFMKSVHASAREGRKMK